MSVIITGVRVALVIAIGVTTIAAAVGAGGLGVFIFRGIRQFDNNLLLAGATPWQTGLLVMGAWALVAWLVGAVLLERRDV